VQSAVKHALAQFSVTPTLDFELDVSIQQSDAVSQPFTDDKKSAAASSSLYKTFTQKHQAHFIETKSDLKHWDESLRVSRDELSFTGNRLAGDEEYIPELIQKIEDNKPAINNLIQVHKTFIIAENRNGFIAIHQQNAHERILYERFLNAIKGKPIAAQRSLFPSTIELAPADAVLLNELLNDLQLLGYLVEPFGSNTYVIQGTPADVLQGNEKVTLENMLEQYKHYSTDLKFSKREKLLRSMAWQQSVKAGISLEQKEMESIINDLFDCETPNCTPNGKPSYLEFKKNELDKIFGR
jgi:DNA mismatch repair protein MutL